MKILFTGASSFTGMWFVRELAAAGHDVVATFQGKNVDAYAGIRRQRVVNVAPCARAVFGCSFGDASFMEVLRSDGPWDLLCHHAADVTNYKNADFNIARAVDRNTLHAREIVQCLKELGSSRILLTGSVFEPGEGCGSEGLPAFSPYGLSKAMTAQIFQYYASEWNIPLGKFVIPNPFGPLEEPRFTNYLMKTWHAGDTPTIRTPDYVRDNIHVSLLAKAYVQFAEALCKEPGFCKMNPSGYIESQGAFAKRFAREMEQRLNLACPVVCAEQTEFLEPRIRLNTDSLDPKLLGWDEVKAWDEIAAYYETVQF
jgi:UDP-glucose 4-epimerase